MLNFTKLEINHFKSIRKATLNYEAGLWKVVGINNDATFDSNGSGKTSVLEAIQQCLFNKTTEPTPIEDVSYKNPDGQIQQYRLILHFTSDTDSYVIDNDRSKMNITVTKNGTDLMYKGIPQTLKAIQQIIGMDFNTFVALTFINHDTIIDMLDNFSSSAMMRVILNFQELADLEKKLKDAKRLNEANTVNTQSSINTLQEAIDMLSSYTIIDITPYNSKKLLLEMSIQTLKDTDGVEVERLKLEYQTLLDKQSKIDSEVSALNKSIASSKCSACGQSINMTDEVLQDYKNKVLALKALTHQKSNDVILAKEALDASSTSYTYALGNMEHDLRRIEQQITEIRTKNGIYEENQKKSKNLNGKLNALKVELEELNVENTVVTSALSILKRGDIHTQLLTAFISILNDNINTYKQFVSLDYVVIKATQQKMGIDFEIEDLRFKKQISLHSLSGGEKTRLRLVVLLAMLKSVELIANVNTNILVFDESLDTLDKSASQDLAMLFDHLIHTDSKFIGMVSHGAQLSDIQFNGTLTVEKTDGTSLVRMEKLQ